jgi:hypothetical protein
MNMLSKYQPREGRGQDALEIQQQERLGGQAAGEPEHQQDRTHHSTDHDCGREPWPIGPPQRRLTRDAPAKGTHEPETTQTNSGSEIKEPGKHPGQPR